MGNASQGKERMLLAQTLRDMEDRSAGQCLGVHRSGHTYGQDEVCILGGVPVLNQGFGTIS